MPGTRRGMRHDVLTVSLCNSELLVPAEDPNSSTSSPQNREKFPVTLEGSRVEIMHGAGGSKEGGLTEREGNRVHRAIGYAEGERAPSTEDLFSRSQLGSAHDKFDSAPTGVGALQVPDEDSLCSRRGDGEGIQEPLSSGETMERAHQRLMASQAAREFAEDALKGYDVE